MKQIPVSECLAGPWLDAAVADALGVMACDEWAPINYPVTQFTAAWELVEKLAHDHEFYIANYFYSQSPGWSVNYRQNSMSDWKSADRETASLAIARAFLKAKGVEFVEVPE